MHSILLRVVVNYIMFRNPRIGASLCSVQVFYAGNEPDYDRGRHCTMEEEGRREFFCRRRYTGDRMCFRCYVQLVNYTCLPIGN